METISIKNEISYDTIVKEILSEREAKEMLSLIYKKFPKLEPEDIDVCTEDLRAELKEEIYTDYYKEIEQAAKTQKEELLKFKVLICRHDIHLLTKLNDYYFNFEKRVLYEIGSVIGHKYIVELTFYDRDKAIQFFANNTHFLPYKTKFSHGYSSEYFRYYLKKKYSNEGYISFETLLDSKKIAEAQSGVGIMKS